MDCIYKAILNLTRKFLNFNSNSTIIGKTYTARPKIYDHASSFVMGIIQYKYAVLSV